jgi:hypothetical protein
MKVRDNLIEMYKNYYHDENVLKKRKIGARQSVEHIRSLLPDYSYRSVIDIGAGDGAVLDELDKTNISNELHAVEISESGCARILDKKIGKLQSINQFDGYHIPVNDGHYELGLAIHVLEHVEHERAFLHEISRVCDFLYVEVPLELTLKVADNIKTGLDFGHINYYNEHTFKNILGSCGLEILSYKTFSASVEYEKLIGGSMTGIIKHRIRSGALKILPSVAQNLLTYMGGAYCRASKRRRREM